MITVLVPDLPRSPVAPVSPVAPGVPVLPVAPEPPVEPVAPSAPGAPGAPAGPGVATTVVEDGLSQALKASATRTAENIIEYFMSNTPWNVCHAKPHPRKRRGRSELPLQGTLRPPAGPFAGALYAKVAESGPCNGTGSPASRAFRYQC